MYDFVNRSGGIIGLSHWHMALATMLSKCADCVKGKRLSIFLVQTGNNSGVIHLVFTHKPGSLRPSFAVKAVTDGDFLPK